MPLIFENLQNTIEVNDDLEDLIEKAVDYSLQLENFKIPSEINVMLVDNNEIRDINNEHRNIDKPTDVLSFPIADISEGEIRSGEGDFDLDNELLILGDIIISAETAASQAEEYGHSFERELAFLVTHGVFHLLGYDHMDKESEDKMMKKQEAVLEMLGLSRNRE